MFDTFQMYLARKLLTVVGEILEKSIIETPTGPLREKLTEANIHRMACEAKVKELSHVR